MEIFKIFEVIIEVYDKEKKEHVRVDLYVSSDSLSSVVKFFTKRCKGENQLLLSARYLFVISEIIK